MKEQRAQKRLREERYWTACRALEEYRTAWLVSQDPLLTELACLARARGLRGTSGPGRLGEGAEGGRTSRGKPSTATSGEAWNVALQIAALRQKAGLSQKELAKLLKTSQQQISRLESPDYKGHSLSTLGRVAEALHARVRVVFEPVEAKSAMRVAEPSPSYRAKRCLAART